MARKLVCDGCGNDALETDEEKRLWTLLRRGKLENRTVHEKEWDLCPACAEAVNAFLARLYPPASGGTKPMER